MSKKNLETLLEFIGDSPVVNKIKEKVLGGGVEQLPSVPEVKLPESTGFSAIRAKLISWRMIIIIILIIWGVLMLVSRLAIKDKETREKIKDVNEILIGSWGVIPLIVSIWVIVLLIMLIMPEVYKLVDIGTGMTSSFKNIIGDFIKTLIK